MSEVAKLLAEQAHANMYTNLKAKRMAQIEHTADIARRMHSRYCNHLILRGLLYKMEHAWQAPQCAEYFIQYKLHVDPIRSEKISDEEKEILSDSQFTTRSGNFAGGLTSPWLGISLAAPPRGDSGGAGAERFRRTRKMVSGRNQTEAKYMSGAIYNLLKIAPDFANLGMPDMPPQFVNHAPMPASEKSVTSYNYSKLRNDGAQLLKEYEINWNGVACLAYVMRILDPTIGPAKHEIIAKCTMRSSNLLTPWVAFASRGILRREGTTSNMLDTSPRSNMVRFW